MLITIFLLLILTGCEAKEKRGHKVDLVGSIWELQAYGPHDATQKTLPGTKATLSFGAAGAVSGNASCNRYQGPYRLGSADSLSFGLVASTKMMCSEPPGVMEQEMAFLRGLEKVRIYRQKQDALELHGEDGSVMIFHRAATDSL